jgi:hypothetical protein
MNQDDIVKKCVDMINDETEDKLNPKVKKAIDEWSGNPFRLAQIDRLQFENRLAKMLAKALHHPHPTPPATETEEQ